MSTKPSCGRGGIFASPCSTLPTGTPSGAEPKALGYVVNVQAGRNRPDAQQPICDPLGYDEVERGVAVSALEVPSPPLGVAREVCQFALREPAPRPESSDPQAQGAIVHATKNATQR